MTPDEELMVIFGALHVVALVLGVVLFMMFLRSDTTSSWKPPEDEEGGGGGGNDRLPTSKPKPRPTGGVPLPDADPARTRLRDHSKLRDARPRARCGARRIRTRRSARRRAAASPSTGALEPDRVRERQQRHAAAGQRSLAPHAHALDDRQARARAPCDAGRCPSGGSARAACSARS